MMRRELLFLVNIINFYFIINIKYLLIYYLFIENEPEIKYYPKSCYTSRKFDSAKLNEILSKDELSDKVVIIENNDCNDEIFISENLGMYNNNMLCISINFSKFLLTLKLDD